MNAEELRRERAKVRRLRQRIKTALSKIPPRVPREGDDVQHWYMRVSERTILEVERALTSRRGA